VLVHCPSLDELQFRQLLELQESLQVILESQGSISSLTSSRNDVGGGERSPLQIELILRSLNPSSAKRQVRALL